jgi:threonine dehydrogenase-like Zn-dependent dehydrogenase
MNYEAREPLPQTMRAVVCYGPEDYRFQEWEVPEPGPEEVVIRVHAVGICASDLKCYQGAEAFWGHDGSGGYCQPPVIAGHEFVGEVVALGPGAGTKYGLALGDRAVSEQIVPTWTDRYAARGQYWLCSEHNVYGFRQKTFGAMAEYMRFPHGALNYKVPASIPSTHAAFIEPLACSIHAVQRGEIEFDHVVVIAGAGPLGLGMVAAARLKHPRLLIALDLNDHRLDVAKKCGADLVLNPTKTDVVAEVLKLTDGYGCDVYIEATGYPAAVKQGLDMMCKRGTFVEFSVMGEPSTIDWSIIGDQKELNIHGSSLSPFTYPVAIDMLAKNLLPIDQIITHELPLSEFQRGIDLVASGDQSIKVILQP